MINSKFVSKKILIPVAIVVVAGGLTIWGLPAIAVVNQTLNRGAPGYMQLPTIAGSVLRNYYRTKRFKLDITKYLFRNDS
jgi:hypothetical protein